jgi:hypothetical protein
VDATLFVLFQVGLLADDDQILDTSSEFIFGQSLNALANPDVDFMHAFEYAQRGTGIRMMLGRLKFLHRDTAWYAACKSVTDFCDQRVVEALQRLQKGEARRTEKDRLRLVDEAASLTADRCTLRSLVLSVFSPAHDGAAVALSNVFFHLARHPRVWRKLRAEVLRDAEKPITYDLLNSYTYLKNVFRESRSSATSPSNWVLIVYRPSRNPYRQWQPAHLSQCKVILSVHRRVLVSMC